MLHVQVSPCDPLLGVAPDLPCLWFGEPAAVVWEMDVGGRWGWRSGWQHGRVGWKGLRARGNQQERDDEGQGVQKGGGKS